LLVFDQVKRMFRLTGAPIVGISRTAKRIIVLSVDVCLCIFATWFAFYLRLDEFVKINSDLAHPAFLSITLAIPIFSAIGLYRAIFRYSGWSAILAVVRAMTVYGLIYCSVIMIIGLDGTPRTVGVIQPLLLFFGIVGSRLLARFWLSGVDRAQQRKGSLPCVMIYGAGSAGRQLAESLGNGYEMKVIGFLDDDQRLHGHVLNSFPIFGLKDIPELIASKGLTHIFLAIPSSSRERRNEILNYLSRYKVVVRTLPSIAALAQGRVTVSDIKDLDLDDLLGRDSVKPDMTLLTKNVSGKTVLVTGAGGSIGSELCRQILKLGPTKILLVEVSEYALYKIHTELEGLRDELDDGGQCLIVPLLASVQDEWRMRNILDVWKPDTVYHAAAYKHVPLVEHNLAEGVKNNVIGTLTIAQLAIESRVSDFVLISTDKAVRPTNVMGASKRLAELCLQALYAMGSQKAEIHRVDRAGNPTSQRSNTTLSMVRFGNVLDSSGSVIPRFRKQIRDGGPITLTHPEITRYFMTIPEAAQLVIQAGALAKGGDVFLLNMGEPVKIAHLARSMIELSGLTVRDEKHPEGDIQIVVSGLRPGEKLYEELVLGDDPQPTLHPKIQRAQDPFIPWYELEVYLETLKISLGKNNVEVILTILQKLVTGFRPGDEVVDWVYKEQVRQNNGKGS
jgi:FlaA1/EpsC-like NDP-sugar epimerase